MVGVEEPSSAALVSIPDGQITSFVLYRAMAKRVLAVGH